MAEQPASPAPAKSPLVGKYVVTIEQANTSVDAKAVPDDGTGSGQNGVADGQNGTVADGSKGGSRRRQRRQKQKSKKRANKRSGRSRSRSRSRK